MVTKRILRPVVAVVAALLIVPLMSTTAWAAPAPPTLDALPPGDIKANPMFSWNAPSGNPVYYRAEILTSPGNVLTVAQITYNTRWRPPLELAEGFYTFRVKSLEQGTNIESDWVQLAPFEKKQMDGPVGLLPLADTSGVPEDYHLFKYPRDIAELSWNAMPGVRSYVVEVDNEQTFTEPQVYPTVANTVALPNPNVFDQQLYWRVRGQTIANTFTQWSYGNPFRHKWTGIGPNAVNTVDLDGVVDPIYPLNRIANPGNPAASSVEEVVLRWNALPGASQYLVRVSTDINFNTPQDFLVNSTTFAPDFTFLSDEYYWKVIPRTVNGASGPESQVQLFEKLYSSSRERTCPDASPCPGLPGYPNGADPGIVNPVPNTAGGPGLYSSISLLQPANGANQVRTLTFTWTPERLAGYYEVQWSTDSTFQTAAFTCVTRQPTITPYSPACPDVTPNETWYWRVRAVDSPSNQVGLWSAHRSFVYFPETVSNLRVGVPGVAGGTVDAPVITWDPVPNIGRYVVTVTRTSDGVPMQIFQTFQNRVYVQGLEPVAPATATDYEVNIETIDRYGRRGPIGAPGSVLDFTYDPPNSGTSITHLSANNQTGDHAPLLRWTPVTGAVGYRLWYRVPGSLIWLQMPGADQLPSAGYAHTEQAITAGNWEYFVEVIGGPNDGVTSASRAFAVTSLPNTGTAGVLPRHCPPSDDNCVTQTITPTFEWPGTDTAAYYKVTLSRDANFTNLFAVYITGFNRLTPIESFADTQAGQALFWYAQPCYANACGADPNSFGGGSPARAFQKQSRPVRLASPGVNDSDVVTVTDTFTFKWEDWLVSNMIKRWDGTADTCPDPYDAVPPALDDDPRDIDTIRDYANVNSPWNGYQLPIAYGNGIGLVCTPESPSVYRFEASTASGAGFDAARFDDQLLDATQYTPFDRAYPDGPIYWRVSAIDGSVQNQMASSAIRRINKTTPMLDNPLLPGSGPLLTPTHQQVISGVTPRFTWEVQPFAASYDIEVYGTLGQPLGFPVLNLNVRVPSWTPPSSLPPGTYGWRVRKRDIYNLAGPWSTQPVPALAPDGKPVYPPPNSSNANLRTFTFTGTGPSLILPEDNHSFPLTSAAIVTEWTSVPGVAFYRLEISEVADFLTLFESVDTSNTTYAPVRQYPFGRYFWRVRTFDSVGNPLGVSNSRTFWRGPAENTAVWFHPLPPVRILDSRPGGEQVGAYNTPWGPNETRTTPVTNVGGVPPSATAVVLNVTVTGTTQVSNLAIWPTGQPTPTVSNLNWPAGRTIANAVTVKVGSGGTVSIRNNSGATNVLADVVGYYDAVKGDGYTPIAPKRIIDSRPPPERIGPHSGWGDGADKTVDVLGSLGLPAESIAPSAVVANVTVTGASADSFLTLYPSGGSKPLASSINFSKNQTIPNAVTVKLGSNGGVNVFNNDGTVQVIIDVVGYFRPFTGGTPQQTQVGGAAFHPVDPFRVLDSRPPPEKVGPFGTPWAAQFSRDVPISGNDFIPSSASAVVMNTTATGTTEDSFLTVWPAGEPKPTASSLNWSKDLTIANSVTSKLGAFPGSNSKYVSMFNNSGNVNVIADVAGYYA